MANKYLSLLDISKRNGTDASIGLVEEVLTYAPEIDSLLGRVIPGTSYKTRVRKSLPAGPAFRAANEGSDIVSSAYEQRLCECYVFDAQFRVDEAVADAPEEGGREQLLADEAIGVVRQKAIALGDQFYRGKTADAKGFIGLQASYDATNMEVSAGGVSGTATSVWAVWNDPHGVHWVFGGNGGLTMSPWTRQQVQDANSRAYFAWVSNLYGWVGLSVNHSQAIGRIKLITDAKPLTDSLIADLVAKFPVPIVQSGNLKLFMNRRARSLLQKSRSVTIFSGLGQRASGAMENVAPLPTEAFGIPIIVTDSIRNDE